MKTFRFLSLIMAFVLALGSVAFAGVINQPVSDDVNSTIMVSGTIPDATYGDSVGVYVLLPGKTKADITEITGEKFKEVLAGYVPALCDENGNYSVVIGMEGAQQGNYTIVAASKKLAEDEVFTYFFASKEAKLSFIGELKKEFNKSGSTSSDLKAKLDLAKDEESETAKLFGIGAQDLIVKVDEAGLAKILFAMAEEDADFFDAEYPSDFVAQLGVAALIQSLNEGWGDITDERLGLSKDFYATYDGLSSKAKETFVADYLKGKGMLSLNSVNEKFCAGTILAALKDATGWKDYEDIIVNHGEKIGVNMKKYGKLKKPSDITDDLADSYSTIAKFVEDVNDAIDDALDGQGGKGGSAGTSSGGSGMSVGGTLPKENVPLDAFEPAKVTFSDVAESHWASASILALAEAGAISGRGDGTFGPDMDVTREEFVKIAVAALGINVSGSTETSFTDVDASAWYAPYVSAAEKEGIISGVGEGLFGTGRTITRQEAAAILYRIATKLGKTFTPATLPFSDDSSIADFAKEAVYALKGAGVISGITAREFAPLANCSRAQSAQLIYGLVGKE